MPNRRKGIVDIRQILHYLRAGVSQRRIAQALGINWRTVKKYAVWAKTQGLLEGDLPVPEEQQRLLKMSFGEVLPPQNRHIFAKASSGRLWQKFASIIAGTGDASHMASERKYADNLGLPRA